MKKFDDFGFKFKLGDLVRRKVYAEGYPSQIIGCWIEVHPSGDFWRYYTLSTTDREGRAGTAHPVWEETLQKYERP